MTLVAILAALGMGADCEGPPPSPPTVVPPTVTLTVNGIPDDMNDLLVLPPGGFVVNVAWQPGDHPVDPTAFNYIRAERWGAGSASWVFSPELTVNGDGTGSSGVFPGPLAPGTWTLRAFVGDTEGNFSFADLAVAVRSFGGPAPIATGQKIWLDFESDRDIIPGPRFPGGSPGLRARERRGPGRIGLGAGAGHAGGASIASSRSTSSSP